MPGHLPPQVRPRSFEEQGLASSVTLRPTRVNTADGEGLKEESTQLFLVSP